MLIPHDKIEEIREAARIEEVIGDYVSLKRRGANMIGLCPFHQEKTPSFMVSPAKGIFKCFGCGKAGDSVRFVMEHEHCSYPDALKHIARKYHIEVEERELTPDEMAAQNKREKMFNINAFAQKYFTDQLFNTEEGRNIGLKYFKERGFRDAIIEKFQLGYNPAGWDSFSGNAIQNGYSEETLLEIGLSKKSESNGNLYDFFHGRVMFPIHDLTGNVIGFGGRILKADKSVGKYFNSPTSEIYDKTNSLYGYYFARPFMVSQDNCILVEGYFDVLSMHQAGIQNVVASSGTSLTTGQIRLIKRWTKNITIIYDGDNAGIKAAVRGTDLVLAEGMNVRVVVLPPEDDPDTFVQKHTLEEVEDYIKTQGTDFVTFKTNLLMKDAGNDPIKRATAVNEILTTIAVVPDPIYRESYIRKCSALLEMDVQTLVSGVNKIVRKNYLEKKNPDTRNIELPPLEEPKPAAQQPAEFVGANADYQERNLVKLLLSYGNDIIEVEDEDEEGNRVQCNISVASLIVYDIDDDGLSFLDPVNKKIFDAYKAALDNNQTISGTFFTGSEDEEVARLSADLLMSNYKLDDWLKYKGICVVEESMVLKWLVTSSLLFYKDRILINVLIPEVTRKLKEETDIEAQMVLLEQKKKYDEQRRIINKELGIAITR